MVSEEPKQIPLFSQKGAAAPRLSREGQPNRLMRHARDQAVMTHPMTLGERLRTARYARKMTQQELAREAFSNSYISAVERDKMTPSLPALRLLAERLSVSLTYLLGEQNLPLSSPSPEEDPLARRLDEAESLLHQGNPAAALEWLGTQEAGADPRQRHQTRWNWLYGWASLQQYREQEAIVALEQGLAASQASEDRRSVGHMYFTLANAHTARHEATAAEQALQAALRCAEETNDQALLGCVQEHYSALLAAQGRYQEAYEHLRRAMASASSSPSPAK